jgi:hypothetical protein
MYFVPRRLLVALSLLFAWEAAAQPVINEIMFHPAGTPEPLGEEWIEIHNPDATDANLSGWNFTDGITFTIPNGTTIPAGGYLVVAANVAAFNASHPGFPGTVVGGWSGRLSNSGENIRLQNAGGTVIDEVRYADEGDWAFRARGPLQFSHRGWMWVCNADGTGRTFELRNAELTHDCGQNWGSSVANGGSPGAANSIRSTNIAPLIKDVKHRPQIPRSSDPIVISSEIENELPGYTATLNWRIDAGVWQTAAMTDTDGDGDVEATLTPKSNLTVIEYYITATDGVNSRSWPSLARTSDIGVVPETFAQVTNALLQVDDSFALNADFTAPGNQPIYRMIMTEVERAELARIGNIPAEADSDAQMNATFVVQDGTGLSARYRCGIRNRGNQTRLGPPNNYHVSFPSDALLNGRGSIQVNFHFPQSQALGGAIFARAGITPQEAAVVRVRVNGIDRSVGTRLMYGRYVRVEPLGSEWTERHFPNDPDGNLYRLDDHIYPINDPRSGEFSFEGTDPAAYADTFLKETNQDDADYSDIINAARIMSAPATGGTPQQPAISDAAYPAAVANVFDVDSFYTFFATDALVGNQEGGLQTGRADDASIYRGVLDQRFRWIPHDLDDIFDIGDEGGNPITRSIFAYDINGNGLSGLRRMFNHPQLVPRYYATVLRCLDEWFNPATMDPLIDQIMGGWVPATDGGVTPPNTSIAEIKAYVTVRRNNILSQIQQNYSLNVATSGVTSEGFRETADGSATFSGTFNVARTYSITVNGQLAQWFYRTAAPNNAGTWRLAVPAGGGNVLKPGLNKVIVRFWDAPNGQGNVIQELTSDVLYNVPAQLISGVLAPGSMTMIAPANFIPGIPVLVRLDLKDSSGALDRKAWTRTVNLTATNGVTAAPNTITLYNGMGSALVNFTGTSTSNVTLVARGGTTQSPSNTPAPAVWRYLDTGIQPAATWFNDPAFDDSLWETGIPEFGAQDGDERTLVDNTTTAQKTWYFRHKFNVADPAAITSLTLRTIIDDGAVVYINGSEVKRINLPDPPVIITHTTEAPNRVEPAEETVETFPILPSALIAGENLIAVEVHQSNSPVDLSFDLELSATQTINEPGNFTLNASISGLSAQKALTTLGSTPTGTNVSGTLPAGTTTWSGVIRVTGDVTVPAGATLNIDPGTMVLVDGTTAPGNTTGRRIVVNGALNSNGTFASPVQITSSQPAARWGQISFSNAQPSTLNHTMLNYAGHAPGVGHTGRGPMLRLSNASLTLNDSVVSDGPAKAMYSSGTCNIVINRSLITRMITGPELENGASFIAEDSNIQLILPDYRESTSAAPDDEDCLYIHNGSGRPVAVRRCAFVRCGDDVFDCLGGPITVEDSILREGWDKGMSLLNNDLTIVRTLIVDCDKAIVPKCDSASTRTVNMDRCTIVSSDHDTTQAPWGYAVAPNDPDPDTPSTGVYTQNKAGQSHAGATLLINATNSILEAKEPVKVDAPYDPVNTTLSYCCTKDVDTAGAPVWPGTGNIEADPLFVDRATGNWQIQAASPCRDTGVPGQTDPDGSRVDMGAVPFGLPLPGSLTWTAAGGPYRITSNVTVPASLTLTIQAGAAVYFDQGRSMTVSGTLKVLGTPGSHVVFSHPPGTVAPGDSDPIAPGIQTGPPKWEGIRIVGPGSPNPMSTGHEIRYADFVNAQPSVSAGNQGALGIIRAEAVVDHCTWTGTHLRMLYGKNCSLTVTHCFFPNEFNPLDDLENPVAFGLDNIAEPLKVEFPEAGAGNPELSGNPNYVLGLPIGGHWRVYYNDFNGNKGHNDVFDADSGRIGQTQILDCRYNYFHGFTGDEHIDLGGDAYIASNIFERCAKDQWTNDHGYANCISSGDKGTGTTIWVVRNLAFDVDHVINCKVRTATIFEHNTVANLHPDFAYTSTPPVPPFTQDVKCSAINLFVPEDTAPQAGDGAYVGFNLFHSIPRVISWADMPQTPTQTVSRLQAESNYLNNIADNSVGPDTPVYHGGTQHPGGFTSLGSFVQPGDPMFVNPGAKNYSLKQGSPAQGTAPRGIDFGASVSEWAYLADGPAAQTASTSASFTVGGPGIVAYKWRLDGGAWSSPIQIGNGGLFSRTTPTVRTATLNLNSLASGTHTLEVLGRDAAGNWQDADPARTVEGLPQLSPTSWTWTVNPAQVIVRINEIRAAEPALPDQIEFYNGGVTPVDLSSWTFTDDPALPMKYTLFGVVVPEGGYASVSPASLALNGDGGGVYLYENGALRDSVEFGHQIPSYTIGRIGAAGTWKLCFPTFGTVNVPARLGDLSGLRINEWFADGEALYEDDWIELANTNSLPVDVSGLVLADSQAGSPDQHTLAPLSFIGPNGYLKLIADGDPSLGPTHLAFQLDAEQEGIALSSPSGKLLDTVGYFQQTTDVSMVRDGSLPGGFGFRELPTGGFEMSSTDPLYLNALAIIRGLRVTAIMYNPIGGSDYEWIELRNVGSVAFELAGVRFVNGIDFTFGSMTLGVGQRVVLVRNLARFRARYGDSPLVAGVYSGNLDNSGEELAIQLPPPFDANVLTFDYSDGWYVSTDGLGYALFVFDPTVKARLWDEQETWGPSPQLGGAPGGFLARTDTYSGFSAFYGAVNVTDDLDRDGLGALVEYCLGMDPTSPNGGDGRAGSPGILGTANGRAALNFWVPTNATAPQGHGQAEATYRIQASNDLFNWSNIATKAPGSAWTGAAGVSIGAPSGGYLPVTVEDTELISEQPRRYLRLQVGWTP